MDDLARRDERLSLQSPTPDEHLPIGWAIVELLGHRRLAGYVSNEDVAGSGFLRIGTPTADGAYTITLVPPASVYAITPATEETARLAGLSGSFRPAPLSPYDVKPREPGEEDLLAYLREDRRLERALEKLRQRDEWVPTDDAANAVHLLAMLPVVDLPF